MASVGADAWLWRKLMIKELRLANVDISTPSNDGNLAQRILQVLRSGFNFVGNNMTKRVNNFWSMDQIMLGCVAKHFNDTTAETENGLDLRASSLCVHAAAVLLIFFLRRELVPNRSQL